MNIKKIKSQKKENENLRKLSKKLGQTFLCKLVLKLTAKMYLPAFNLQILRYQTCDRSNEEITKVMPWFKTKGIFNFYINIKEENNKNNNLQIIFDIASQAFYKYKKKFSIIKKSNEDINNFYLIFNGTIQKLNLVFKKVKISIENYLLYLYKMLILKENQILKKCFELNKAVINIDINNNNDVIYIKNDVIYNLKKIKNKALNELINEGFIIQKKKIGIASIDKFIELSEFNNIENRDTYKGYSLYVGKYIKDGILKKGDFIGDLSRNENYENSSYVCINDSDIVVLDKKYTQKLKFKLYDYIHSKIRNIFSQIKSKFYFLKDVSTQYCLDNITPLITYKTYKKGEKIIEEFSTYEGIYLIVKGKIKLSLSQTYQELSNTLSNLINANSHFKDYAYKALGNLDIVNEFNLGHIINNKKNKKIKISLDSDNDIDIDNNENELFSSNKYKESFKGLNDIQLYTLEDGDALGFHELIDFKTGLYNFSAECISDESTLLFINKNDFNALLEKKMEILKNVIQLVEKRAKLLIGKIMEYKNRYKFLVIKSFKDKDKPIFNIFNNNKLLNSSNTTMTKSLSCSNFNINKNYNSVFNTTIKHKKINKMTPNNIRLFKNNSLLNYLKNSNFFDYSSIYNNNINNYSNYNNKKFPKKIQFKSLLEIEKNLTKNETNFINNYKEICRDNLLRTKLKNNKIFLNLNKTLYGNNNRFLKNNSYKTIHKMNEYNNKLNSNPSLPQIK